MLDFRVRYRKYALFLLIVLVSVLLLTAEHARPGDGLWVADAVAAVTAPVQAAMASLHRGATYVWSTYLDWKALRLDVERLGAEVEALRLRQLRQAELEAENRRFRALLGLREEVPLRTIGAEVVAREWSGFTRGLTINRGRGNGVQRLAPVIVTGGVVGRVAQLRRDSAVIQLLTDPASSIGAVVSRTRAPGLVEGALDGGLTLKLAAREEGVAVGDLIVTSGMGGLFPKGLPLGRVTRVSPSTGLFRIAELEPTVDLATVEEVLVLPRGAAGDLRVAFPGA